MTQVPPAGPVQPLAPVCYRHPKRETGVRCTRCDRPICPDCMNAASVGFQCPECVSQGRRTQRERRTVFGGTLAGTHGRVTITLIAINVLVEILSIASAPGAAFGGGFGGILGGSTPVSSRFAIVGLHFTAAGPHNVIRSGVSDGEYYRLVTNMFVHYGPIHLLANMWALWIIGRVLETALGPLRYTILYFVAGLGGSVSVYLFAPYVQSAGASGAIFGLFAALFIVFRRLRLDTSQLVPVIVINVILSFAPGISFAAHFGGAVTGAIVAWVMAYAPQQRRNLITSGVVAGLLVLFAIAIVAQTASLSSVAPPPT
jgi:membrane associated rhomboid family serine protease